MSTSVNAVVVGGCLVSFTPQVSSQDQEDIQACLLYAELAANEKYPDRLSRKVWFDYFQGRLLKAGFTLKTLVPSDPILVASVRQLLSESYTIMGKLGVERLGQLFQDTFKALRLDEFAWDFFRGNVAKGGSGILKCAPCERLTSGEVVVCLLGLRYSATVIENDFFLWSEFDRELAIIPGGGVFVFNRGEFENYRKRVHEKIDAYSSKVFMRKLQS